MSNNMQISIHDSINENEDPIVVRFGFTNNVEVWDYVLLTFYVNRDEKTFIP